MSEIDGSLKGRLYKAEVCEGFYGLKPHKGIAPAQRGKNFHPESIGQKKYDSIQVAIKKAFIRLEERGLAICLNGASTHWSGVKLTEMGQTIAATIVLNEDQMSWIEEHHKHVLKWNEYGSGSNQSVVDELYAIVSRKASIVNAIGTI